MQCTAIILVVYQTVSRAKSVNWHKIEAANGLDMPLLLYSCTIEEHFFFVLWPGRRSSWCVTYLRNGILLPILFWPTVRKNCSSNREKLLKFQAEGREFAKILRSLKVPSSEATVWINWSSDLKIFKNPRILEFQRFFSITRTIFSHSRSEQFW